jgi:hypothetical protein
MLFSLFLSLSLLPSLAFSPFLPGYYLRSNNHCSEKKRTASIRNWQRCMSLWETNQHPFCFLRLSIYIDWKKKEIHFSWLKPWMMLWNTRHKILFASFNTFIRLSRSVLTCSHIEPLFFSFLFCFVKWLLRKSIVYFAFLYSLKDKWRRKNCYSYDKKREEDE